MEARQAGPEERGAKERKGVGRGWAGAVRQVKARCDQGLPPCKARTLSRVHREAVLPAGDKAARAASSASLPPRAATGGQGLPQGALPAGRPLAPTPTHPRRELLKATLCVCLPAGG